MNTFGLLGSPMLGRSNGTGWGNWQGLHWHPFKCAGQWTAQSRLDYWSTTLSLKWGPPNWWEAIDSFLHFLMHSRYPHSVAAQLQMPFYLWKDKLLLFLGLSLPQNPCYFPCATYRAFRSLCFRQGDLDGEGEVSYQCTCICRNLTCIKNEERWIQLQDHILCTVLSYLLFRCG